MLLLLKKYYCWDPWCTPPSHYRGQTLVFIIFVRKPLTKRLVPDPVVLLHSVLVAHPLQKILYSDHAIRICHDLQYELRLCVALSFLSSRLRPGNMMSRIPRTVGSMKSWDATLTAPVRVGCSKLHCGNESWCSCRSFVARMQVLAPLGSESVAKHILRCTPSWLILTAAEGCSHWSFGDRTSLFCRAVGCPKRQGCDPHEESVPRMLRMQVRDTFLFCSKSETGVPPEPLSNFMRLVLAR